MPCDSVNQIRLCGPAAVPKPVLALEVQVGGMPGWPGGMEFVINSLAPLNDGFDFAGIVAEERVLELFTAEAVGNHPLDGGTPELPRPLKIGHCRFKVLTAGVDASNEKLISQDELPH